MQSIARQLTAVEFPTFAGVQLYMKEVLVGLAHTVVPPGYMEMVRNMLAEAKIPADQTIWITIDESHVEEGKKHRRGRAHVDGCYDYMDWGGGGWLNGVPGRMVTPEVQRLTYENPNGGMLIASNFKSCQVWEGEFEGVPGLGGDCEHFRDELNQMETSMMPANVAYMANSTCIHESLPVTATVDRQLIRITLSDTYQFH